MRGDGKLGIETDLRKGVMHHGLVVAATGTMDAGAKSSGSWRWRGNHSCEGDIRQLITRFRSKLRERKKGTRFGNCSKNNVKASQNLTMGKWLIPAASQTAVPNHGMNGTNGSTLEVWNGAGEWTDLWEGGGEGCRKIMN